MDDLQLTIVLKWMRTGGTPISGNPDMIHQHTSTIIIQTIGDWEHDRFGHSDAEPSLMPNSSDLKTNHDA
jgi:hypothetical protein